MWTWLPFLAVALSLGHAFQKCCPLGSVFIIPPNCTFPQNEGAAKDTFYDMVGNAEVEKELGEPPLPSCPDDSYSIVPFMPHLSPEENFELILDRRLNTSLNGVLEPQDFCLDVIEESNGTYERLAVGCLVLGQREVNCPWRPVLYSSVMIFSAIFLALTAVVYLGLPSFRAKFCNLFIVSEVISQFFFNVTLSNIYLDSSETDVACRIVGTVTHFTHLASYFWMNVLCVDLWQTLRSWNLKSALKDNALKKYLLVSLYGWGIPFVVTLVGFILDEVTDIDDDYPVAPKIKYHCFVKSGSKEAHWIYLYSIPLLLLIINMCLFGHVAYIFIKQEKEKRQIMAGGSSHMGATRKTVKYFLYLKLFIVMGVSWILDIVSYLNYEEYCAYWAVTDVFNLLRGFFIFIILVCKKSTFSKIMNCWVKPLRKLFTYEPTTSPDRPVLLRFVRIRTVYHTKQDKGEEVESSISTQSTSNGSSLPRT